ncbi:thioredoxin domain-containing protein 17 [Latimeria chalumnae]|uniref:Thioredoxin domain-containing protein 17 n=1 Tax=Latimeria chalumnae TaxID=7897 RepID=H3BHF7_LATCH|nr:PREDICTED: thioredoxin domain-containing protein 17 [Latimeria chalumnae]|eukprot:XP_005987558.1 PREDICTED: thioredoxin domain-containing protein 17 [Latimeria chalumnae]
MPGHEEVNVCGFEGFMEAVEQHKDKQIFAYFSGSKNEQGVSWCPDCVRAEPVVHGELGHMPEGSVFIYCQVGEKPYWKNPNNEFREKLNLTGVPTLLKYGTQKKLVEAECFKADLVQMLLSEE